MKKALVIFILALFVATGAFAQLSVAGQIRTDFGWNLALEDFEMDATEWQFVNFAGTGTWAQVAAGGDVANGWVRVRANNSWVGLANVNLGNVTLRMGQGEPVARWSNLAIWGDSNWGIGASSFNTQPYVEFRTMGFYAGLAQAGVHNVTFENNPLPGFYAGYDMSIPGIGLNFAFAARPLSVGDDSYFPFMINARGQFLNIGPATITVNAAIYSNPEFGFWAITAGQAAGLTSRSGDDNLLVLEALLDAAFGLGIGTFVITAGCVTNFDSDQDGIALQVGASLNSPLGGGFSIRPGFRYRTIIDQDVSDVLGIGLSLQYNF